MQIKKKKRKKKREEKYLQHLVHCLAQQPLVHLHFAGSHLHEVPSQPLQMHGQHPLSPPLQVSPHTHSGPQLQDTGVSVHV